MASSPILSVSATEDPSGPVLALHGEIDLATEAIVMREVAAALARRPERVVLDLGAVTFLDVRGLGTMIEASWTAGLAGCRLELRSLPPIAERLIAAGGVGDLLDVTDGGDAPVGAG